MLVWSSREACRSIQNRSLEHRAIVGVVEVDGLGLHRLKRAAAALTACVSAKLEIRDDVFVHRQTGDDLPGVDRLRIPEDVDSRLHEEQILDPIERGAAGAAVEG